MIHNGKALRDAVQQAKNHLGTLSVQGRYIVFTSTTGTIRFNCDSPKKAPKVLRNLLGTMRGELNHA